MSTRQIVELKEAIDIQLGDFGPEFLIKYFEPIIIEKNDSYLSWYFASAVKGANIKVHEQIVLSGEPIDSYYFAQDVEGADIKAHEQHVLNGEDYKACFAFARYIEGADMIALFNRMKELSYTIDDKDPDELNSYHASLSMIEFMIHTEENKPRVLEFKNSKK